MKALITKFEQLDGQILAKLERGHLLVDQEKWFDFLLPIQIIAFLIIIIGEIKYLVY